MLFFEERGNRSTRRKPLSAEQRTNKLNPHMKTDLGIEPGPRWWEASALTTAPSLHPPKVIQPERCPAQSASLAVCDWLMLVMQAFHYRFNSQEGSRFPIPLATHFTATRRQASDSLHCIQKRNGKDERCPFSACNRGNKHRPPQSETSANNFCLVPRIDKDEAGNSVRKSCSFFRAITCIL